MRRAPAASAALLAPGGPKDYGTSMSRSPALGPDGRLAEPDALGQGTETRPSGSAQCTGRLGAGGSERPQETPGTWYWQVWRLRTGCPSGYETAPVRRLVIRSEARAILGKVAPDGSFIGAATPEGRTAIRVIGRLRRGVARGRVSLSVGPCVGNAKFSAPGG